MGFLVFILGLGGFYFSFFHLISHAFFKRSLFLGIGVVLHGLFSSQDFRVSLVGAPFSVLLRLGVSLFALCGLFFTSGFISKDLVLGFIGIERGFYWFSLGFWFSLGLTFFYVFRLFYFFTPFFRKEIGVFSLGLGSREGVLPGFFLFFPILVFCGWSSLNREFCFIFLKREKNFFLFFLLFLLLGVFVKKSIFWGSSLLLREGFIKLGVFGWGFYKFLREVVSWAGFIFLGLRKFSIFRFSGLNIFVNRSVFLVFIVSCCVFFGFIC